MHPTSPKFKNCLIGKSRAILSSDVLYLKCRMNDPDDSLAAAMTINDGMVQKFWKNAKKLEAAVGKLSVTANTFKEERREIKTNFKLGRDDMDWLNVKSAYPGLNKSVKRELVSTAMSEFLPQASKIIKSRMSSAAKAIEKLAPPPPVKLEWSLEAEYELKAVRSQLRRELCSTAKVIELAMLKMLTNPHSTLRKRKPTQFDSDDGQPKAPLSELQGVLHLIKDELQEEVSAIPFDSRVKIETDIAKQMDKHIQEELLQLKVSRGRYLRRDLVDKTVLHAEAITAAVIKEEIKSEQLASRKRYHDEIGLIRMAIKRSELSGLPLSHHLKQLCVTTRSKKRFSKSEDQSILRLRAVIFLQQFFRTRKIRRHLRSCLEHLRESRVAAALAAETRHGYTVVTRKEIAEFKALVSSKCLTKSPLLAWRTLLDKRGTGRISYRDLVGCCVTLNINPAQSHVWQGLTSTSGVCTIKDWDQDVCQILKELCKSIEFRYPGREEWFCLFTRSRSISARQFQRSCAELKLLEAAKARYVARHLSSREDGSLTNEDFAWLRKSISVLG